MKFNRNHIILLLVILQLFLCKINIKPDHKHPYTVSPSKRCFHKPNMFSQYMSSNRMNRKSATTQSIYSNAKFENIRIHFDYTYTLPEEEKIFREFIIPPVKSFYETTLKVRRLPGKIYFPEKGGSQCYGVEIPEKMKSEGVDADAIIFISTVRGNKKYEIDKNLSNSNNNTNEANSNFKNRDEFVFFDKYFKKNNEKQNTPDWDINDEIDSGLIGWSYACIQDAYSLRPIVGLMQYVMDIIPNESQIEEAIWTTLHEFMHIFAFDHFLFSDFINNNFERLGINNIIRIKSRLKGLKEMIVQRKDYFNDFDKFVSFDKNNTENNKKNTKIKPKNNKQDINVNISIEIDNSTEFNTTDHEIESFSEIPKINLTLLDEYEEIPVPSNFNLTTLLNYIDNFRTYTKMYVSTPKVLKKAKEYYGCQNLIGMELEHMGGLGSAYVHWSKKILNTEFMIADSYGENYISELSLALLEDSGWYKVDYSKAQGIKWGKGKGCDFLNEKCINEIPSKHFLKKNTFTYTTKFKNEFCTNFNEEQCSINRKFRGICAVREFPGKGIIPPEFNYFSKSTENQNDIGGITEFGDYCPYPLEIRDQDNNEISIGNCITGEIIRKEAGEKICEDCRCFHSSLLKEKKKNITDDEEESGHNAVCYEAKCKIEHNGKPYLAILIEDNELRCPYGGGKLTVEGYNGEIECPHYSVICGDNNSNQSGNEWLLSHISKKLLQLFTKYIWKLIN